MDTIANSIGSHPPSISKKNVDGIILVLSCQKHKNTRLKEFSLSKTSYNNWEVIYVIGDLFLKENYVNIKRKTVSNPTTSFIRITC